MDELDDRGKIDMSVSGVSASAGCEEHRKRSQALAAAVDDIAADLVDQHHVGPESTQNQGVNGLDVLGDGLSERGDIHEMSMDWLIVAADARCGMWVCQVGAGRAAPSAARVPPRHRRDSDNVLDPGSLVG